MLLKHFGCYGNLKVSIVLQWEKWKLRFITISLQIFWQKIHRNVPGVSPLQTIWILSKSLILIGCHGNQNVKFSKKILKKLLLRNHKGDEAESLPKCLCCYPLHKLWFLLLLPMWLCCYGHFKFPYIYNGKSERRPLFLSDFRYSDKSFTVMFLE